MVVPPLEHDGPVTQTVSRLGATSLATRLPAATVWPLALAPIVTLLSWPAAARTAQPGLDNSWIMGLHLAAQQGLRHGVDVVFTYGPLGFLMVPRPAFMGATSTLGLLVTGAIYLGLAALLLISARRVLPLWAALLVALLAARLFAVLPPPEALLIVSFLWAVEAVAGRIRAPALGIVVATAVIAAIAALGKLNVGAFVLVFGAVASAVAWPVAWRGLVVYLVTVAGSALGLWLLAGQRLTDLPAFASGAYQIVAGYQEAMGADPVPQRAWVVIAIVGVLGLLFALGYLASRDWIPRRRIGLAVLGVVIAYSLWKLVVVREHATFAFATATLIAFAFATRLLDRRTWLAGVAALGIAALAASTMTPARYLDVVGSARTALRQAADAFVPGRGAVARDQAELRRRYHLDQAVLAALAGRSVTIDPYEIGVVFAYPDLRWSPLPVLQQYSAYTSALDELDAERLRSAEAPDVVLRQFRRAPLNDRTRELIGRPVREGEAIPFTVDGRFRWFDAPVTTLETFCRYREVVISGVWQVLVRTTATCADPEPLGSVSARVGETVEVPPEPRPDRFITVAVHGLEPSVLGRIRTLATKGRDWYVWLDGSRYRLVPGTAADGMLLAVPPVADGSGPFAFGPPVRTIAIAEGLTRGTGERTLTYEFLSVPVRQP
jgi:hypothetical protein